MPSLLARCAALLRAPANELAFAFRAGVRWSRGVPVLPHEGKSGWLAGRPADERRELERRAAELVRDFHLAALWARSTLTTWAGNLALLDNLATLSDGLPMPASADGVVRAADLGSGDFHYAFALQRWLSRHAAALPRTTVLRAFELDGHGVYRDGFARADHARAHAALASDGAGLVRYEVADATRLRLPEQDVVTLLFPFLSTYPLLAWGLPLSRFRPRRLLLRAVATVRPGGWLAVANQTSAEFARLRQLLRDEPVDLVRSGSFASAFAAAPERTAGRVGSLWVKRL